MGFETTTAKKEQSEKLGDYSAEAVVNRYEMATDNVKVTVDRVFNLNGLPNGFVHELNTSVEMGDYEADSDLGEYISTVLDAIEIHSEDPDLSDKERIQMMEESAKLLAEKFKSFVV